MTERSLPPMTNVSNPAAYGVEWRSGEGLDAVEHQLVNPRGTTALWFESRSRHTYPKWVHTDVVRPERFGLTSPPKTWKAFEAVVLAFLDGSHEGNETP